MKIYVRSAKQNSIPASLQVNKIGKFLYTNMDGAYKFSKQANMFDVYVTLLYQVKPQYGGRYDDVNEMTIDINITTYQNKIRINTIEMTPEERTLGYDLIDADDIGDLKKVKDTVEWLVGNRIRKAYKNYTILF